MPSNQPMIISTTSPSSNRFRATTTTTSEALNKYHHPCCCQTLVLRTPLGHQQPPLDDIGLIEYGAIASWPRPTTSPEMILKNTTHTPSWSSMQQILMKSIMTTFQKRERQDTISLEMHGLKKWPARDPNHWLDQ